MPRTVKVDVVVTIMDEDDSTDDEVLQMVADALTDAEIMAYCYPPEE